MNRVCPVHGTPLEPRGHMGFCPECQSLYRLRGVCGACGADLEWISACGASNWFCNHCNELKSKSSVSTEWVPDGNP